MTSTLDRIQQVAQVLAGFICRNSRGRGTFDYQASHDLEDLIDVVDGRAELVVPEILARYRGACQNFRNDPGQNLCNPNP
jgi:hypothetical protein